MSKKPTLIVQLRRVTADGTAIEGIPVTTLYHGTGDVQASIAKESARAGAVAAGAQVFMDGVGYLPNGEPATYLAITTKIQQPAKRVAAWQIG